MKRLFYLQLMIFCIVFFISCKDAKNKKPHILVFYKNTYYFHESIPAGIQAIIQLGQENNFTADTTSDATWFTEDTLKKYAAVVFLNNADNTGSLLNHNQEANFERYIQAGGGYVGIHAASDAEYDWGWYGRLVGGYFDGHPDEHQLTALNVVDTTHISTKHLSAQWRIKEEWYNFRKLNKDVNVLITIDEKTYQGGTTGDYHPMAWYHEYDGGRAWYTALGHREDIYKNPEYLKHILGGIMYAIGKNKKLNYAKAKTQLPPDEDRFVKNTLALAEFFEPTEMTILPNLDILVIQRRGEILLYKNETKKTKQAGYLNVYWKTNTNNVNAEEGLLGIAKDPNFSRNNYVYIFYSPSDTSVNRLSRFEFKNDTIDNKTEKIILQFYSQREICCHTGGSIAFGPDGLLYLSTGDNSTPFDEEGQKYVNRGFAPLDDRPGHEQYDARRSAGNSNDLRGKILRIKIKDDGTYEIPEGNLYPKGTSGTRLEIYVQGTRNPYRISVDPKNSYLYWGEVGPDSDNDSLNTRGPRGYDEVNQARKAGNFGWPFLVGDNYAYYEYDYATGKPGMKFVPEKLLNKSKNNTGLQELPPAQPAFIWYPYGYAKYFPQVGTGGRNAMAGPVFYSDMYPKESRLPDYYNGKLFVYDWIRGWIKSVTMRTNGDFDKMEPFMEHIKLANPIDMELGPDGKIYILEYGTGWFQKNPDAALSRIDYIAGNRAPKITKISVDKPAGALPFAVKINVDAMDPEKDNMTYIWNTGDGSTKETKVPELIHTYTKTGDFSITVDIKDKDGASVKSEPISVYAGNTTPVANINIIGNQVFYFPGKPVNYTVTATDKEDTAISPTNLFVSADYIEGTDLAAMPQGHQQGEATISGRSLVMSLDCKSCHKEAEKSIGPAYVEVAKKYQKEPKAHSYLADKILKGGGGVWGETQMAAHPSLPASDIQQMVQWIMSLSGDKTIRKSLPPSGSLSPSLGKPVKDNGVLSISASYTDNGGVNTKSLTGRTVRLLRNNKVLFTGKEKSKGYTTINFNGVNFLITPAPAGWFALDNIDLSGIGSIIITAGWQQPPQFGFDFEIRLDGVDGKLLGARSLTAPKGETKPGQIGFGMSKIPVEAVTDGKLHTIYIVSKTKDSKESAQVGLQALQFNLK